MITAYANTNSMGIENCEERELFAEDRQDAYKKLAQLRARPTLSAQRSNLKKEVGQL